MAKIRELFNLIREHFKPKAKKPLATVTHINSIKFLQRWK